MTDIFRLAQTVTCHAWNADGTKIAVCPNSNEIHIYAKTGVGSYKLEHVLTEHDQVVTGIDWGKSKNRIVSCSQDRNAYVWTFENGKWKPVLVILRINRAATQCKWSPQENKFAVASGAKLVSVCYFEEDNDWWVSKHIKKAKSTILTLDWHPNNVLLATGGTDKRVRVFDASIKGVDKSRGPSPFPEGQFGDELLGVDSPAGGWVQATRFSPNGNVLGFVCMDSTVNFVDLAGSKQVVSIFWDSLPFVDGLFINDSTFVAVGHDNTPVSFTFSGGKAAVGKKLDKEAGSTLAKAAEAAQKAAPSALKGFQDKVDKGAASGNKSLETVLKTEHQNSINCAQKYPKGGFSTSGMDGAICLWANP